MRKPVLSYMRTTKASAQSSQRLCCSLPGWYYTYTCVIQNFKTLARFCSCADRFESYLVATPEDWFSRDVAQTNNTQITGYVLEVSWDLSVKNGA